MAAVAVLAILLSSLSWAWWVLWLSLVLVMFVVVFGLFVLLPTALAPRNHRVEVAYWAMAHPSVDVYSLVRDLAVFLDPRPLRPIHGSWSQLSGYKSNRFNWLERGGSGSCGFFSLNA